MNSEANEREAGGDAGGSGATEGAAESAADRRENADDAGGYVHRPAGTTPPGGASDAAEASGVGRRGWVLVAAVVLCVLVIPGVIYLRPSAPTRAGWGFFATMLVLPLIPAVLLGLIAVWSMKLGGPDRGE